MNMKHPLDWFAHFGLCFLIALFRWDYAVIVGLTIEGTQIESGSWQGWDHLIDLIADGIGVGLGYLTRIYIFKI